MNHFPTVVQQWGRHCKLTLATMQSTQVIHSEQTILLQPAAWLAKTSLCASCHGPLKHVMHGFCFASWRCNKQACCAMHTVSVACSSFGFGRIPTKNVHFGSSFWAWRRNSWPIWLVYEIEPRYPTRYSHKKFQPASLLLANAIVHTYVHTYIHTDDTSLRNRPTDFVSGPKNAYCKFLRWTKFLTKLTPFEVSMSSFAVSHLRSNLYGIGCSWKAIHQKQ